MIHEAFTNDVDELSTAMAAGAARRLDAIIVPRDVAIFERDHHLPATSSRAMRATTVLLPDRGRHRGR